MERFDSNYDYSSVMKPISPEDIKNIITEELMKRQSNFDLSDPKNIENIDFMVKRQMFSIHESLNYITENEDDSIEEIIEGTYE